MANNVEEAIIPAFQKLSLWLGTENRIVSHFISLACPKEDCRPRGLQIKNLLSHFNTGIRRIIRATYKTTIDYDQILLKVVEECYNQASATSGTMHVDDALILRLGHAAPRLRDPNIEGHEYHGFEEHTDARETEDNLHSVTESIRKIQAQISRAWIDFWVEALHEAPGGPTLFYPPANKALTISDSDFYDIPRYLFRVFDVGSHGLNTDCVIASNASAEKRSTSARTDFLSLNELEAAARLVVHLSWRKIYHFDTGLVSWTSSLLFAIQYAIYRCHTNGRSPAQVKICLVDTSKFPRGQFIRDIELIRAYKNIATTFSSKSKQLIDLREKNPNYYNGEHFSQGSLSILGRSCVVSLEALINDGLYQLYPDFKEPDGRALWANRVLELRERWECERTTTYGEIEQAIKIAKRCFPGFEASHVALMLLAFKNRKSGPMVSKTAIAELAVANLPTSAQDRRPVEVRRYTVMARKLDLAKGGEGIQGHPLSLPDAESIKGLFEYME
ncbi:hypothetical protein F5Y14DRAFT_423999 [Nemania sp. NC0429]|nr:hypothetical protein F5Y14DRAFT_423999 [Nemania sp. NC0429]